MIDDVAAYLDANGGYDSPVFVATVEFIVKIRQMLQSIIIQQQQNVSIADNFGQKEVENVNFNAARSGVENDDEIEEEEREKIVENIVEIQARTQQFIENNSYKELQNEQVDKRGKTNKRRETKKGNSLLEKLFKLASINSQRENQQKQQKQQEQGQQQQNIQQQQNQRQVIARQQQSQQSENTGRISRMNLLRMNLMNSLRSSRRTVIEDSAKQAKSEPKVEVQQAQKVQQVQQVQQVQNAQKKPLRDEMASQKAATQKMDKKITDANISKVIDEAVKSSKQAKQAVNDQKPTEKGKFELKTGEKSNTPRADDKKVSEMAVKDAIAKLQQSGVRTETTEVKTKKEVDAQIVQAQGATGGGATPKLQR